MQIPAQGTPLRRITAGLPSLDGIGSQKLLFVARQGDAIEITQQFQWRNGKEIFDTSTSQIRRILYSGNADEHISVARWTAQLQYPLHIKTTCNSIWKPFLSIKESCFAWQVLYQIAATNQWRFQGIPNSKADKLCGRCKEAIEDTLHCLWGCVKAKAIWNWVTFLVPLTSQDTDRVISITPQQALLGDILNCSPTIPQHWWMALRVTTLWNIWLDRIADVRYNRGSVNRTKARIWQQMRPYLRAEWSKLSSRVKAGSITDDKAIEIFGFTFGTHDKVCTFEEMNLTVIRAPPEPD